MLEAGTRAARLGWRHPAGPCTLWVHPVHPMVSKMGPNTEARRPDDAHRGLVDGELRDAGSVRSHPEQGPAPGGHPAQGQRGASHRHPRPGLSSSIRLLPVLWGWRQPLT